MRLVLGGSVDRASAFRRARVHSGFVRVLRTFLPILALGLCGYYALTLKLAMGFGGLTLPSTPIFTADDMTMENPRYEGFNKDGGRFLVTAKTARQDLKSRDAPVRLAGIDGKLLQPDQTVTDLKAKHGTFDSKTNQLELFDGIEVVSQNGMTATLSKATILTKESTIISREPVSVEMPTGSIRARQMQIDQKARLVAFTDGVVARVTPERKTAAGSAAAAQRGFASSDAPVDITAERLDIDDAAKLATFRGNVRAVQGESVLVSEELEITYEGAAGDAPATGGATRPAAGSGTGSRLKQIASRKPVVLTQGSDRITGDSAYFDALNDTARVSGRVVMTSGPERQARSDRAEIDQRADVVVLTGNVLVGQGKNEMKGRRLWVDRKSGRAQLTAPAEAAAAAGRITTRLYQSEGSDKGGKRAAAQPAASGGPGIASFKSDPTAPIDVEAVSLEINDAVKTAVYRGDVRVAQGDFKMTTPEMTAYYVGQMGLAPVPASQARETQAKSQAQLTKIEARKGVQVVSKEGETATGDWADFDAKSNTITLGGDVRVSQGPSMVRSSRLIIDLTTGEIDMKTGGSRTPADPVAAGGDQGAKRTPVARTEPQTSSGTPKAWTADTQPPIESGTPERPRGVFYVNQLKGLGSKSKDAASATAPEGQATESAPRKRRAPETGGSDPAQVFGTTGGN